ncbi:MAG: thioredoxin family protein [Thermodesulfobacteriota bacterium]|nr:thioredoxin family protein [Thermodesulfobacteriota bacterium]
MKFKCRLTAICISILLVLALSGSNGGVYAEAQGIQWRSYEQGVHLADKQGKKIFLHFYADWCHYCKMMVEKTFADQDVVSLLNDKFVSIRVNSSKKQQLANEYSVRGVPMSWFLESDGDQIGSRPGYLPPEDFMNLLEFVVQEKYKN